MINSYINQFLNNFMSTLTCLYIWVSFEWVLTIVCCWIGNAWLTSTVLIAIYLYLPFPHYDWDSLPSIQNCICYMQSKNISEMVRILLKILWASVRSEDCVQWGLKMTADTPTCCTPWWLFLMICVCAYLLFACVAAAALVITLYC